MNSITAKTASLGFTLVEALLVLALIGILTAMSIPTVTNYTAKQNVDLATSSIIGNLNSLRADAINGVTKWATGDACPGLHLFGYQVVFLNGSYSYIADCVDDSNNHSYNRVGAKVDLTGYVAHIENPQTVEFVTLTGALYNSSGQTINICSSNCTFTEPVNVTESGVIEGP